MQPSPTAETCRLRFEVCAFALCLSIVHSHIVAGEKQTEDAFDTVVSHGWAKRFLLARSRLYTVDGRRFPSASRSILTVNWINGMVGLAANFLHLFCVGSSLVLAKRICS
jgi:hypothetical protein